MLISPQNLVQTVSRVQTRIRSAAASAARDPESIVLIAVSKGRTAADIRAIAAAGVQDIGENYWQEAAPKIEALADLALTWHFIGALQANKAKAIATACHWVHSVDRLKLAARLAEHRPIQAPPLNLCIQVALVPEGGKSGVAPGELALLAAAIEALPRIRLRGLMCIPPPETGLAVQRDRFTQLARLRDELNSCGHRMDTLSMGMSDDFEAAIAAGATHVRIGTALFGPRAALSPD
jgi:pyridoxal phosphate enzyme (YggS family)